VGDKLLAEGRHGLAAILRGGVFMVKRGCWVSAAGPWGGSVVNHQGCATYGSIRNAQKDGKHQGLTPAERSEDGSASKTGHAKRGRGRPRPLQGFTP
jgi:hypothetical protein